MQARVRHRLDDLEIQSFTCFDFCIVRHRLDDLENVLASQ